MGPRIARIEFDGPTIADDGCFQAPLLPLSTAKSGMGGRTLRPPINGFMVGAFGIFEPIDVLIGQRKIAPRIREIGRQSDRRLQF